MTSKIVIAALLLGGVGYWLLDSAIDTFIFQNGTFQMLAFSPSPSEFSERLTVIALFAGILYANLVRTREKKKDEDLREREKLLSESQRIAHIGSWNYVISTGQTTWSDETYRLYGVSHETFTPTTDAFLGLIHPDDRGSMEAWIRAGLAGEATGDIEFRAVHPDGAVRMLHGRGSLERDADNQPVRMVGTVQDITESKLAEKTLQESEAKFRTIFENSLDAIVVSKDDKHVFANPAYVKLFGYDSLEELIGMPILNTIAPEERDRVREFKQRREQGLVVPTHDVTRGLRKDGSLFNMDVHVTGYLLGGERYTLAIIRDITEAKRAQDLLRQSEEKYRSLVERAHDGIIIVQDNIIKFANARMAELDGSSVEELVGTPYTDHVQPSELPRLMEIYRKRMAGETPPPTYETILRRKNGRPAPSELNAGVILYDGRPADMVIIRDITERREADEERQKLQSQLLQAQKMEAVGQLAGGVAHDFNNILSAIIGYGHLAMIKMPNNDPQKHNIEQILQSAERATVLTQSLLTFSRKQPVKMERLELNAVLGNFEKFLLRLLREDIKMKTHYAGEALTITADRGQIEQLVMNLVTNARDAMPERGTLVIETKPVTLDEAFVRSHGYGRPGECAVISVSDTGCGMDEETKQKIFEPFFTTKEQGKGTGLGLATVYGIVKAHDGFINVDSEPGRGTVFHIYLPLIRAAAGAAEPVSQAVEPLKGGTETVLLAEDDDSLRKMTSIILRHVGYTVIEAINGQEAVQKFIENKDSIKLVILDGIMPVMNGKEAHREITSLVPGMRCIFMSGYAEDVFTKDGVLQSNVEFISKPATPSALLRKVRDILDR